MNRFNGMKKLYGNLIFILFHFGKEHQMRVKLVEEMEELKYAIDNQTDKQILDELCDVIIMLFQLIIIKEFKTFSIIKGILFKVNRTIDRIKSGWYEENK